MMTPPHEIYTLLPYRLPWLLLLLVVLAVLTFFLWLYFRKRRPQRLLVAKRDLVADARAQILRLRPPAHFPRGKVQENYFFALGIAFRQLLEYRWKIKTVGATVREIKPRLVVLPLTAQTREEIVAFMQRADQVKFANHAASLTQAQEDYQQVVQWTKILTAEQQESEQCN